MKKLLILATALALLCSLAVPALADSTADERLAEVTAKVKETLGLDTERYTGFYGSLEDNPLAPTWELEWSNEEGESLYVSALEDGKIISCSAYDNVDSDSSGGFAPTFPKGDRDSAKAAAAAFLDRVLTEGETALAEESDAPLRLGATTYRFYGEILINGLSAGLSYSVTVRCSDNKITRFYRDDLTGSVMGDIPSPTPSVTAEKAAATLRDTLSLRLEYVAEDGGSRAVLRWLPEWGDDYYVDAATGALIDLTELYANVPGGDKGATGGDGAVNDNASESASDSNAGLSSAEQEGIAKLEGVLSREALDAAAQKFTALGLDKYTLATVSYTVDRETEEGAEPMVTAYLRYGRQVEDYTWRRNVTLNARTGELLSVSSSGRLPDDAGLTVDLTQAQTKAESFLRDLEPDRFAKSALYNSVEAQDGWSGSHSFTFAQKENGYFFPANSFNVRIDATDGSVSGYSKRFNDDVTFDSAEGLCTADEAVDAWLSTFETKLQYILVPTAIDFSQPEYAPLEGMGVSYLYTLALGYQLSQDRSPLGIDAKTAKPVYPNITSYQAAITYDDLEGHWVKTQAEKLAAYGVGFSGGSFQPDKALTQLDLLTLLVSTQGWVYTPGEDSADDLYEMAYSLGLLTRDERNDDATLTRSETVKLIIDASGYGELARLQGIYRTDFTDDKDIPAAYYGCVALARGLGIVSGNPGGLFLPNETATRAEAATMLYNLMAR